MNQSIVRILQVPHGMDRRGVETMLMNYYRHIDRSKLQFDFLLTTTHKCDYEDEILANGGKIYHLPQFRLRAPESIRKYMRSVDTFLKAHPEYKVVHSHSSVKGIPFLYVAKRNNIPIRIVHSHTIREGKPLIHLIMSMLKLFLRKVATHFFACGANAAEGLYGKRFTRTNKIEIVNNAIETSLYSYNERRRFLIRTERGWTNKFVIGHVGQFVYPKNHGFILDIFKEVKKYIQIRYYCWLETGKIERV
jgi:glycosyltransferase involved in cell wall biosynthesis